MNINFIWIKNLTVIKKIFFLVFCIFFLISLISIFYEQYFLSYMLLFWYTFIFIFFKKWYILFYMIIVFIISIFITKFIYYEYYEYESNIKIFIINKMESNEKFVTKEFDFEPMDVYESVKKKLYNLDYSKQDIEINFKGQFKSRLFYNIKVKDVCFKLTMHSHTKKTDFFRFFIEEEYDCNIK